MSLNSRYDISILFGDAKTAVAAWEQTFSDATLERSDVREGQTCLWKLHLQAIPLDELDARLWPQVGSAAWISVDADLTGLYGSEIQRFQGGLMDQLGTSVRALLRAGGTAVVLHKAAGTVKPAQQFLNELDGLASYRPWLDFLVTQDEQTRCRTYGMPHYMGLPNIHAHSAHLDVFAAERCFRAVTAALVQGVGEQVCAPMWFDDEPAIVWQVERDEDQLAVHLRSDTVESQNPAQTWPKTDFELYALMLSDLVLAEFRKSQFRLFDAILLDGELPCRVLCLECAGLCLYVTAGFGRVPAPNGNAESATQFVEYAALGPWDTAMIRQLAMLADIAHASDVPGGVKDYDILSAAPNMDGFVAMPLNDLGFEPQPIAMRMFCPFFSFERPEMALDPAAWCGRNLGRFTAIADRWSQYLTTLK
ncbi:MAG: hypothetical protein R3E66_12730 [bacterium]